jgi:hypothetical protein
VGRQSLPAWYSRKLRFRPKPAHRAHRHDLTNSMTMIGPHGVPRDTTTMTTTMISVIGPRGGIMHAATLTVDLAARSAIAASRP